MDGAEGEVWFDAPKCANCAKSGNALAYWFDLAAQIVTISAMNEKPIVTICTWNSELKKARGADDVAAEIVAAVGGWPKKLEVRPFHGNGALVVSTVVRNGTEAFQTVSNHAQFFKWAERQHGIIFLWPMSGPSPGTVWQRIIGNMDRV